MSLKEKERVELKTIKSVERDLQEVKQKLVTAEYNSTALCFSDGQMNENLRVLFTGAFDSVNISLGILAGQRKLLEYKQGNQDD